MAELPNGSAENLIRNGNFEASDVSTNWQQNNWAGNEVEFALDRVLPHAGSQSQRIELKKVLTQPNLQFCYSNVPVLAGDHVQLKFWTRGPANTRPILVQFRKQNAPYTSYFQAEVALSEAWSESSFVLTLPPGTDPKETSLIFTLTEANGFWLDDVSLTKLPARDPQVPLPGNQIKNGSFEVGRDHWFATFREGSRETINKASENNIAHHFCSKAVDGVPHGSSALSFAVREGCSADVTSAYFPLHYGYPATISFWMKTSVPGSAINVKLGQGKFPNHITIPRDFVSQNTKWNFYSFQATPAPSTSGTYFFEFSTKQEGSYHIDAVRVEQGSNPGQSFQQTRIDLGWTEGKPAPPAGNIFFKGDAIGFRLNVQAPPALKNLPVTLRLIDYQDKTLKQWNINVALKQDGFGSSEVSLPSDRFGGFKVDAVPASAAPGAAPLAELVYSVVPRLKPLKEAKDSFFGSHVNLTPYNLAIAERLGYRWLRLHPPVMTKWFVVEPEKDKFDFDIKGVSRASSMGFQILGLFDSTPTFYADGDPKKVGSQVNFAPADMAAWRRYVQKTAEAFSPYIQHWEIWNEPNSSGFLQVPAGVSREKRYVDIQTQTRQALEEAGIDLFLLGNSAASLDLPFTNAQLELGGGRQVDALSFHLYNETTGPEEKPQPLVPQLEKMKSYMNRSGKTPELWHTEGGVWLSNGRSWLVSAGIPTSNLISMRDAANALARTAIALKAMGVKRHFQYGSSADPSGRIVFRDECSGVIDVNGIPHPAGAAHAAAVFFLEDTEPGGLEVKTVGDARVTISKFLQGSRTTTVVWSNREVPIGKIPGLDWGSVAAFDMMGNPLSVTKDTPVTLDPIYLRSAPPVAP